MYRQGDVLCIPIDKLPPGSSRESRAHLDRWIIARGEKTGHMHVIKSRAAEVFRSGSGRFLSASEPVTLTHDEHAPLNLPAGNYEIVQQREWKGEQSRAIED